MQARTQFPWCGLQANSYLLATCYFRAGQPYRAYQELQGARCAPSRYLLALTCMQLPDKLPEAERALLPQRDNVEVGCWALTQLT